MKRRAFEEGFGVFLISLGEELHGFVDAVGRRGEAFAVGIFAKTDERFADEIFVGGAGESGRFFCLFGWGWLHKSVP